MLRSNRKGSWDATAAANTNNNATALPSFYTTGSASSSGTLQELVSNSSFNNNSSNNNINATIMTSTPSIPFPTLQKRRKRRFLLGGSSSSTRSNSKVCPRRLRKSILCRSPILQLFWSVCVVACLVGTYHYVVVRPPRRHTFGHAHSLGVYADTLTTDTTNMEVPLNEKERQLLQNARRRAEQQQQHHHQYHQNNRAMLPPKPPTNGWYDVVVLGTGPAGLTAALFAARAGLSTLVLGSDGGSLLSETHLLQNFPSYREEESLLLDNDGGGGSQWLDKTKQQAAQWGASFVQAGILVDRMNIVQEHDTEQQDAATKTKSFDLQVQVGADYLHIYARSVIVATGATGRRLGLPLENELWGKSVHSCAVCDGSSYVDKTVVVVGGGDAAIDGALLLARYAREVILVHRRPDLRASNQRNVALVQSTPNIRLELSYTVERLETMTATTNVSHPQQILTAVELKHIDTHATQRTPCDGVFELIGSTPNTKWLLNSGDDTSNNTPQMDETGFLLLSANNQIMETRTATTLEGVFAAGEVTDKIYRQAITAAAEGAQAAMDAERWLRVHPASMSHIIMKGGAPAIPLQKVLLDPLPSSDNKGLPEFQTDFMHRTDDSKIDPLGIDNTDSSSDDCDLTQEACITKLVNRYPVVVFSKPWCPYCRKALEALSAEGLSDGHKSLHIVDLSLLGEKMRKVQGMLNEMTGRRTVPNVFLGGVSIGGGDETSRFHRDGTLRIKLNDAKAFDEGGKQHGSQEEDSCDDLTQEACITRLVNRYAIVVFSKQGCPHCRRALEALAMEGVAQGESPHLHVVDLTTMADQKRIQDQLESMTGRRTVPNVFIGGSSIGGGSETVQLQRSGDLRTMLEKVRAFSKI